MARGKDLAGLAALGALGMMLSKGKGKGKEGADTSGMDTGGFEGIKDLPRRDTGMSEKEPGERPRPKEDYSNEGRSGYVRPPVTAPVRSMAKARPRLDTSGVTDMDLTGGAESPDQTGGRGVGSRGSLGAKLVQGYGGRRFHPEYDEDLLAGRARDRALNAQIGAFDQNSATTYKKGGAVKKMASGGMASSASKRADGIATKGKTRGKMC
jgi:hypothetical protein